MGKSCDVLLFAIPYNGRTIALYFKRSPALSSRLVVAGVITLVFVQRPHLCGVFDCRIGEKRRR
jgi:hypothetical protein